MRSKNKVLQVLAIGLCFSLFWSPRLLAGRAEINATKGLLGIEVKKPVDTMTGTTIPLDSKYVEFSSKPSTKKMLLTVRALALKLEQNEKLLRELQGIERTVVSTEAATISNEKTVGTTSCESTKATTITTHCEKVEVVAESCNKDLNEPTLRDVLETFEMTPELRARYEDLLVLLNELKGSENSPLRAALYKFFLLAVADQGNTAVQNQVGDFFYTIKKFSERQGKIEKLVKSTKLEDKITIGDKLIKQMKTLAWATKILRKAKMYDQVSYCKGEHEEKVGTFMNSGSIEILKYSLAHTSVAGKELKTRYEDYKTKLKSLRNLPDCAKVRLEVLHNTAKEISNGVANRQERCEKMVAALSKWKPGTCKWNEAYNCAVKLQRQVQDMHRAFGSVEAELMRIEKIKAPVEIKDVVVEKKAQQA